MASKIGGVDGNSPSTAIGAGRAVQRPQDAATGGTQNTAGRGSENVEITGTARQLARLEAAIRDLPVVNNARVEQIGNAIAQGNYSVNSRHIANQLIQMEKALKDLPDGSGSEADPEPDA